MMEAEERNATGGAVDARPHRRRNRWLAVIAAVLCVFGLAAGMALEYIAAHAGPMLRSSVVATLSRRFESPVELDSLDVSVAKGLEVHGRGLRVLSLVRPAAGGAVQAASPAQGVPSTPTPGALAVPMLSVKEFRFRTTLSDLLHLRANIGRVEVEGMEVHIPPRSAIAREQALLQQAQQQPQQQQPRPRVTARERVKQSVAIHVAEIDCRDVLLVIETGRPDKAPLQFAIRDLRLTDVGMGRPMGYVADLVNPKPVGDIHATGTLGPWVGGDPRLTPLDGRYTFLHVNLATIRGLRGTLSSVGQFQGHLSQIAVDGTTSTPDFALDVSGRPVPLQTQFHALVDATTGDTRLDPVQAVLRRSAFTARGDVARILGKGHDIALSIEMPSGRIQDILQLSMKTEPPVMRGAVELHAKLHIPPGKERVAEKMEVAGRLRVSGVEFTSAKLQGRIDGLSVRTTGGMHAAKVGAGQTEDGRPDVASKLAVTFALSHGVTLVPSLRYEIPGATVQMAGVYMLQGREFEFRGHARTVATASQMVTGWKSLMLKPFDGMFKKDGAGMEVPIEITGSHGEFKVGFARRGLDETPQQMEANLKALRNGEKNSE
jgi:hypothetical protein